MILAARPKIKDHYANAELRFDDSGALIDLDYTTDQAALKSEQLAHFCRKHRIQPEQCIAVGDGDNDIELFRKTGHGILIDHGQASVELRQSAWKTVRTLLDVKRIVIDEIPRLRETNSG